MDPIADKALVLTALVLLCVPPISYIHWSVIVIIATREFAVSLLRYVYNKKSIVISANIWGKLKTVVQMTGIITALVFYTAFQLTFLDFLKPFEHHLIEFIKYYFWLTALITILSGMNYFFVKYNDKEVT